MAEPSRRKALRCAIYTRKSSEEGLEQDFNSLHAQREACEAFVVSQKHEGWKIVATAYNDGGFSGGSIERPALQRLLADVAAGEIDVVVVYKVDRLTRSLPDFARIVEVFDGRGVSFVSVTQAFNTTTSMGRLTLNVLLSFAQFEREVTGERIRDKIAASKKKGLWMGGHVPIGYAAAGRTLTVRDDEAETIRTIYTRYLALKSVDALKDDLERLGLKTRMRPNGSTLMAGGKPFSRGHLYRILANPIYAGRIEHKGQTYEGLHPAIIDQPTFDAVQMTLAANSHARLVSANSRNPSLLSGLLYDTAGEKFVATHATRKGRRYRYYFSQAALRTRRRGRQSTDMPSEAGDQRLVWRLPAAEVEGAVIRMLIDILRDERWFAEHVHLSGASIAARKTVSARARERADQLEGSDQVARRGIILLLVERVVLDSSTITATIRPGDIYPRAAGSSDHHPAGDPSRQRSVAVTRPFLVYRRGEVRLVIDGDSPPEPESDPSLIKAVAQAHRWWRDLLDQRYTAIRELAAAYDTDERYVAWILRLAFLTPDVTRSVIYGTQPPGLSLHRMLNARNSPVQWSPQAGR